MYHFIYLQLTHVYFTLTTNNSNKCQCTALKNILNWLKTNKLKLNVKKSQIPIFNINKNNNNTMQIKLFTDKEELEQKVTTKYIGIYFDNNLTWNKHIKYILQTE